jgi:hypothetical protein
MNEINEDTKPSELTDEQIDTLASNTAASVLQVLRMFGLTHTQLMVAIAYLAAIDAETIAAAVTDASTDEEKANVAKNVGLLDRVRAAGTAQGKALVPQALAVAKSGGFSRGGNA